MDTSILQQIQAELKAPKNQYNAFGKYNYRSAEDIQEALKPLLAKHGYSLVISDTITQIGERVYVKAQVKLLDEMLGEVIATTAYAREPAVKKGMDESQITGAVSSYARKYALGGMFLIDDTKDADGMETEMEEQTDLNSKEKTSPMKEYLEHMATAKNVLNDITGSDEVYYAGLETIGVKHANEVTKLSDGNKLLAEFRTFVRIQKKA